MVAIGEGPETKALLDFARPIVALYVGGMGAKGKNFYNDARACQYGYEKEAEEIQDLYLDGKKKRGRGAGARRVARGRATSSAPSRTSRSGSPPSQRPVSPTSSVTACLATTRPPPSRRSRNGLS